MIDARYVVCAYNIKETYQGRKRRKINSFIELAHLKRYATPKIRSCFCLQCIWLTSGFIKSLDSVEMELKPLSANHSTFLGDHKERQSLLKMVETSIHINISASKGNRFVTPPRNRGGVIFSLQFVCVFVYLCVCVSVSMSDVFL